MRLTAKLFQMAHPDRVAAYQDFPGPKPTFPHGNRGAFGRRPAWRALEEWVKTHGNLTLIWSGSRPVLVVSDEKMAQGILAQGQDAFEYESPEQLLGDLSAESTSDALGLRELFHSDTSPSLLQTPWLDSWLSERLPILQADIAERATAFARETSTGPKPLFAALLRITFNATARLALGQELSQQAFDDFLEITLGKARKSLGFPVLEDREDLFGTPMERMHESIGRVVSMAERYPDEERKDLIGRLLDEDYAIPRDRWAAELLRIFQHTSLQVASTLTNTLHHLSRNPAALERLELELDPSHATPSHYRLMHMPVLDSTLREGRRLASAIPLLGRRVKANRKLDFDGRTIPAGTGILVHLGFIQKSAEAWDNPERFDPTRWSALAEEDLSDPAKTRLAHGGAAQGAPTEMFQTWLSKLVLFTWLRTHTVLAGEGFAVGQKDRFASGLRLPAWVTAKVYARKSYPVPRPVEAPLSEVEVQEAPAEETAADASPRQGPSILRSSKRPANL